MLQQVKSACGRRCRKAQRNQQAASMFSVLRTDQNVEIFHRPQARLSINDVRQGTALDHYRFNASLCESLDNFSKRFDLCLRGGFLARIHGRQCTAHLRRVLNAVFFQVPIKKWPHLLLSRLARVSLSVGEQIRP